MSFSKKVAVDRLVESLADDQLDPLVPQVPVQLRIRAALDRMVRPERLRPIGHLDDVEGLPAGMAAGEAAVPRRMPVLRRERMQEGPGQQSVDDRHHFVAAQHGQFPARHEGRLHVDNAEHVGRRIEANHAHAPIIRP
ncbi:hypothetical protein [Roseococcus sp. YIM B11640]|uniref:hypothetical protein n=1 Tax=Roseococcus sp. YIM B11640 TaxID=3133973 RepID=UPI003C7E3CC3